MFLIEQDASGILIYCKINLHIVGTIDEVKIWNRTLTADEIKEEYDSIVNPIIRCYNNLDCGTPIQTNYCSNDSACTSSSTPICNNNGTTSSFCTLTGGGGCTFCAYGCEDGACKNCAPNCAGKTCGSDGCGGSCGDCIEGYTCNSIGECAETVYGANVKNMLKYSNKEAFLISDKNWKELLPLVPLTTWTGQEQCQREEGTADSVCVYPTLIYHEEETLSFELPTTFQESPASQLEYSVNGKSLVRIYLDEKSKEQFLKEEWDIATIGKGYVDVVLSSRQKEYFEDSGYDLQTIPINLPFSENGYSEGGYHTYDSMVEELNTLSESYPNIAKVYKIGESVQNRSILAMKISDNVNIEEDEAEILVVGNHHARELMTVEVPMFMINYLLENYDKDPELKKVVDSHELWFVPMINPDGHVIVETTDPYWRKNARDNNGDSIIDYEDGVDLNRNYGYAWGYDDEGSSSMPSSSSYRGTSAFSEPETQAIRDLALQHNFNYVLDYHGSGGYILYPWGHIYEPTLDDALFRELANNFNVFLNYPSTNIGQISHVMYLSNGDSISWYYGEQTEKNKIMGFGFELNPGGEFCPPSSDIVPTSEEQMMILLNLTGYLFESSAEDSIDADSVIHFLQQYSPDKLTIIGETLQDLDNLLIAERDLGAGLLESQIQRINSDDYLSYWESYEEVVYVEDNYELALMASSYASLINAPLIIQGTGLDVPSTFSGKKIICVGSANPSGSLCNEQYSLEQLQERYLSETGTTKIILTNPDDLDIYANDQLYPDRTSKEVSKLYGKTSLAAPILASAKHELILTDKTNDHAQVDSNVKNFFENTYNENIDSCLFSESCASGFGNNPVSMSGARNSITFFLAGKSDITISEIDAPKITLNNPNEINITVSNFGFDKAENVILEAYFINESGEPIPGGDGGGGGKVPGFSSYSSEFVLIDRVNIGDIIEDDSKEVPVTWTPTKVGSATLWFNVSTSSNESNLNNNDRFEYVYVEGPAPDLEVSVNAPSRMLVNNINQINASIRNIGTIASSSFNVNFYENSWVCDNNGCSEKQVLIQSIAVDSLAQDEENKVEFEFTPTEQKYYDFLIKAELSEDINSENNEKRFSVRAGTGEPDITYNLLISEPILVNQEKIFLFSLTNYGFETAKNTIVDFYIKAPDSGDFELIGSKAIGELGEEGRVVFFNWTPEQVGYHILFFNISYEYSGGKGNREIWESRKVRSPGPDLNVWLYAEDVELGTNPTIEMHFSNEGSEVLSDFGLLVYDEDKLIINFTPVPMVLDPGESFYFRNDDTEFELGAHELKLVGVVGGDIDLSNNQDTRTIQVYKLKNITFEIINNSANYISRYLGIAYNWQEPETIEQITSPKLFSVPDMQTDFWIINSENMSGIDEENTEYVLTRFINSDLHDRMLVISEDYKQVREEGGKRLYRIYANEVFWNYENADIVFNYPDYNVLGTSPENLTIYYCENWDFDYENCLSMWTEALWINKYTSGNRLSIEMNINSAEAFALGEPISGSFKAEVREKETIDFSEIIEEYQNSRKFLGEALPEVHAPWYQISIPGFFYDCGAQTESVEVSLNGEHFTNTDVECYNDLPGPDISTNLINFNYAGLKNITLDFSGSLIFHNPNELMSIVKEGNSISLGEGDSTGLETISVNSFGSVGSSEFSFENKNYTYFVVNVQAKTADFGDFEVSVNGKMVGELDLSNSNGEKGRGFEIPNEMLNDENFSITLKPKTSGVLYLADVKMKTNFDDYYLTIVASPDAIPFEEDNEEADFQRYGSLDEDSEGEFSVGRIMGITSSDVSAYLARDLFYNDIKKESGASFFIIGDHIRQGIPARTCGTGFCECYFDVECSNLYERYSPFFEPFKQCDDDFIGGIPRTESGCTSEVIEEIKQNLFYNSSFSMFGDHGAPSGWGGVLYSSELRGQELEPQFMYSFACLTCAYNSADNYGGSKSDLFCTNTIRQGAIGYIGAVESIPGHHFLNEFLDETLINNQSVGYAFKIGKNKEARYDWETPNLPDYAYIREDYGVHDILVGDPTFDGGIGK